MRSICGRTAVCAFRSAQVSSASVAMTVVRSLSRSNKVTSWCGSMDFPCLLQAPHEGDSALFIHGDSQELAAFPQRPVARVAVACDAQHAAPLNTRSGA